MEKVVFLDRDGTINEEVNYLYKPEDMVLLPGAAQAIARLNQAGFKVVVVTNQAGVARGYYTLQDVDHLHDCMNQELKKQGAHIDAFYACPHHPTAGIPPYNVNCDCRKPKPGLLKQAETYFSVDKAHSYMIGDKLADTEAGKHYGITSILVGTGYGTEHHRQAEAGEKPVSYDCFCKDLGDAAAWILEREGET
ncbi:MAG: D-glycero-beta-D-manno-heptose 1,7-bisphosphate 7-phosphatase [Lachnospiraceae bacterium]